MNSEQRPILGISAGDPAGIGAEVALKALGHAEIYGICRPVVVADRRVLEEARRFCGLDLEVRAVADPAEGLYRHGTVDVLDLANLGPDELRYGKVTVAQGRASFEYVRRVIELALAGAVDGTVTGPINKEAINAAGFHYSGHTEIFAELTGSMEYAMMLAAGNFRVAHVSTHVSLVEACRRVKKDRILRVIRLTRDALLRFGIAAPRIAVAGLNPHCGEGGLFGDEDAREILPAVEEAKTRGIDAEGPIPADTVFPKMKGGMYDAVVVMYHDQGHIPIKLIGFEYDEATGSWVGMSGVNVTLGLPVIRTSVDHGTAFDRAGQGRANEQSMLDAIRLAATLARTRQA